MQPQISVQQAFQKFIAKVSHKNKSTGQRYSAIITHFAYFIENIFQIPLTQVQEEHIISWRDDLKETGGKKGYPPTTLQKLEENNKILIKNNDASVEIKTTAVGAFYKYLRKKLKLITEDPFEQFDAKSRIEKYGRSKKFSFEIFEKILDQINQKTVLGKRNYCLLVGYFLTGRRREEIVRLRWKDIILSSDPPTYRYVGKGHKEKTKTLPTRFLNAIYDYCQKRWGKNFKQTIEPEWYLFSARKTPEKSLTGNYIWKLFKDLAKEVKNKNPDLGIDLDHISIHGIRHLFSMETKKAGAPPEAIQELLDHADIGITAIYLKSLEEESQAKKWGDIIGENLK